MAHIFSRTSSTSVVRGDGETNKNNDRVQDEIKPDIPLHSAIQASSHKEHKPIRFSSYSEMSEAMEGSTRKNMSAARAHIERTLDLRFVDNVELESEESEEFETSNNIGTLNIPNKNIGALEAYNRAKIKRLTLPQPTEKRVKHVEKVYDSIKGECVITTTYERSNQSVGPHLHNICENCEIMTRRRRLAEALEENLEQIKYLASEICDVCERRSCDGINHYGFPSAVFSDTIIEPRVHEPRVQESVEISDPESDSSGNILNLSHFITLPSDLEMNRSVQDISAITVLSAPQLESESLIRKKSSIEFPVNPSTLTLNFKSIDLNPDGIEMLEFSDRATKGYRFAFTFLQFADSLDFLPTIEGVTIYLKQKASYTFDLSPIIYEYLRNCCLHVELYDIPTNVKRKSKFIGKCDICFNDVFKSLGAFISKELLITDADRINFITSGRVREFGMLNLEISLRTSKTNYSRLLKTIPTPRSAISIMGTGSFTNFMERNESPISLTLSAVMTRVRSDARLMMRDFEVHSDSSGQLSQLDKGIITDNEQKAFTDALQLVLVRNKALRTTQSEIDTELNDRAEWMHEELKWRLTLQEHAILSGKDPESIRWRQWRDENTSDVRFRTIMDEETEYEPVVAITIKQLELLPLSAVMLDEKVQLIYVEYAFLTHSGLELETKSLPKNAEGIIVYDCVRKFDISIDRENLDTQVLADHIKTNQNIRFTVVNEPIERPQQLQSCKALGFCEINLFNLAQQVSNIHEETYTLKNFKTGAHDVGHLSLRFDGVRAMRTVALTLLAPAAFKIYR